MSTGKRIVIIAGPNGAGKSTFAMRNFETLYRNLVDEWLLYDNSGDEPILVAEGRHQ